MIHILFLWCLLLDDKATNNVVFPIQVLRNNTVEWLKKGIKDKMRSALGATDLCLWKLHEPMTEGNIDKRVQSLGSELGTRATKLDPDWTTIPLHFPDLPDEHHLYIIVTPEMSNSSVDGATKRRHEDPESMQWNRLKGQRREEMSFRRRGRVPPPHSAAPYLTRTEDLPLCLYNEAFANFQDSLAGVEIQPTAKDYEAAEYLFSAVASIFKDQSRRHIMLRPMLEKVLAEKFIGTTGESASVATTNCSDNSIAFRAFLEIRNQIGNGQSDSSIQGGLSYWNSWGNADTIRIRASCYCPSFIIAISGPWICILGAAFLDKVVVQPLTDFFWIGEDIHQSRRMHYVARVFRALSDGLKWLDTYYRELAVKPAVFPGREPIFPNVRSYPSGLNGQDPVKFTYIADLLEVNARGAIFKAKTEGPDERFIVVKFAPEYNTTAHHLLASHGFAPKLLCPADGNEPYKIGGLHMIVMEFIHGETAYYTREALPEHFLEGVQKALSILHEEEWVFGDLRTNNIMVAGQQPMMIDFDCCAKDGVGRYPTSLNDGDDMGWHPDVERGGVMRKEHDDFMLKGIADKWVSEILTSEEDE